jgi:hypothetical protein
VSSGSLRSYHWLVVCLDGVSEHLANARHDPHIQSFTKRPLRRRRGKTADDNLRVSALDSIGRLGFSGSWNRDRSSVELDKSAEQAPADDLRERVYALARLVPPTIDKPRRTIGKLLRPKLSASRANRAA